MMRDIDHIAAMAMMGLLMNPGGRSQMPTSVAVNAYNYAKEFMKIKNLNEKEEREGKSS